jgi:hypothetical protein
LVIGFASHQAFNQTDTNHGAIFRLLHNWFLVDSLSKKTGHFFLVERWMHWRSWSIPKPLMGDEGGGVMGEAGFDFVLTIVDVYLAVLRAWFLTVREMVVGRDVHEWDLDVLSLDRSGGIVRDHSRMLKLLV